MRQVSPPILKRRTRWGDKPTGSVRGCANCAKEFYVPPSVKWKNVYCSKACYYAYRNSDKHIRDRFWSSVVKTDTCWNFTKRVKPEGYCFFSYGPQPKGQIQWYAHRFSWFIHFGEIPPGMEVAHRCDNRQCVRPDHLFLATHEENLADMREKIAKGRKCGNRYTPVDQLLYPHMSRRLRNAG